jgi:hypothetical protein
MPRKEFESFTRLDASDVNTFLMDQSVQTFAGTAARGSAIATPVEGMVTYLNDINSLSVYNGTAFTTDRTIQVFAGTAARGSAIGTAVEGMYTHINDTDSLEYYDGSAWVAAGGGGAILQVVSVSKSDAFSTAMTTYQDVTGLSLSITPSSATSKILLSSSVGLGATAGDRCDLRLMRDSTAIGVGDSSGATGAVVGADTVFAGVALVLDTPNTTSAVTYKAQIKSGGGANVFVNRRASSATPLTFSSLIAMEVAG